jgi:hypothetical protein
MLIAVGEAGQDEQSGVRHVYYVPRSISPWPVAVSTILLAPSTLLTTLLRHA